MMVADSNCCQEKRERGLKKDRRKLWRQQRSGGIKRRRSKMRDAAALAGEFDHSSKMLRFKERHGNFFFVETTFCWGPFWFYPLYPRVLALCPPQFFLFNVTRGAFPFI